MNGLKLVIGSRNSSSWSLRPWLLLRHLQLPFEEVVIPLRQPDTALHIRRYSPSGKVPVLIVDGDRIWDSLAIAEYLAERHPGLWPADPGRRALARSVSSEMHSGFAALRTFLPMDFTARFGPPGKLLSAVEGDIDRIGTIWTECRRASGGPGPFLFGSFTIVDAMFAPVCSRFATYAVPLDTPARSYVEHMMALPAMQEWDRLARSELAAESSIPEIRPAAPIVTPTPVVPESKVARTLMPIEKATTTVEEAPVVAWEPAPEPELVIEPEPEPIVPLAAAEPPPPPPPQPPARPIPEPAIAEPPAELRRAARPIPSTLMVKPIGGGTRRRR
jgi:glutathione S-transferase